MKIYEVCFNKFGGWKRFVVKARHKHDAVTQCYDMLPPWGEWSLVSVDEIQQQVTA
jgi:hypothetical protein